MASVLYRTADGVARITLNRPARLNAINAELAGAFRLALARAADDPAVAVILVEASGRAFCSGDDLVELASSELDDLGAAAFVDNLQAATRLIMLGDKPVVCAARGWIVGGGAAWPLNADFAVVSHDAVLFCPEARHGLFPTGGVTMLLPERCGPILANDILWLGARLDAARMLACGIATQVAATDSLETAADKVVQRLLALPAASRIRLKRARSEQLAERLERALAFEAACCLEATADPEIRERVAAGDWR